MATVKDLSGNSPVEKAEPEIGQTVSDEVTTTGQVVATSRSGLVKAIHYESGGSAGQLILRSGGASGEVIITLDVPAVAESDSVTINDKGIQFTNGLHATLTNVAGCTVFYSISQNSAL